MAACPHAARTPLSFRGVHLPGLLRLPVLVVVSVTACGQYPAVQPSTDTTPPAGAAAAAPTAPDAADAVPALPAPAVDRRLSLFEQGNGNFIADGVEQAPPSGPNGEGIHLNFQDTDIREFVQIVLNEILDENYVIDERVAGTITINTVKPVDSETALALLEDILAMHGAALIRKIGLYHVVPKDQVAGNLAPTLAKQAPDGHAVRIIPLQFIAAGEMQKILEPFMAEGANVRIDRNRNLVFVSGTRQEIATVQDTIEIFDVDWLRGMSVGLYPLDYVTPGTMKGELQTVLSAMDEEGGDELLGGLVRVIAMERLQSILLVSSTPAALREAEVWLHRLDRPGQIVDRRLFVYHVQNAKAKELGSTLKHIFNMPGRTATDPQTLTGPPVASEAPRGADPGVGPLPGSPQPGRAPAVGADGAGVTLPSGQSLDIIADDTRNALVILATPADYKMVLAALTKLDIVPLQVLIEASIVEVSLRDELGYGVEWFFKNNFERGNVVGGRGALDLGSPGITALSPSFSYTILDNADQARVALNALEQETQVNVLSSPSLMVLGNQTAFINIGDEIPVPARQSVSNIDPDSPTVNEIQFRQTGITLSVTPRVNSSGLVTMEISQEVSNAVSTTSSGIDAPTIQQRQLESTVAVHSGETLVLGGLIQETTSQAESGIPLLRRIPLVGKLFGETREEQRRTELLVLLTPRVIGDRNEARKITEEFRQKIDSIAPAVPPTAPGAAS